MKSLTKTLLALIEIAKELGLRDTDLKNSKEFLEYHEFGLCFDTIITQLYEYDIEIDNDFYEAISQVAEKMNLPLSSYSFMKNLVRSENSIPQSVKERIALIISSLSE